MRIIIDMIKYCSEKMPKYNTISVSGYHIREAGSTAVQELAFTLANGFSYIDYAIESGLNVDEFAPRLSFFFNSHLDFFEEIAKFRAARRIWANVLKRKYNAQKERSLKLRFHTQTAGFSLTAQQPENNIVRVAMQAMAAVLGGTQSLHTNSMDEALALPSEKAARIALRTQQVLAHESGITDTVDPLGGSYFIETMTEQLYTQADGLIDKIDELGGMVSAIEQGYPQRAIESAAYDTQLHLEHGKPLIFGKEGNKGIRINHDILDLEIVTIGEKGITTGDILVHDETNRTLAGWLARMEAPDFPVAIGVLYCNPSESYDRAVQRQAVEAKKESPVADLNKLLQSGHTWNVG